MIKLDEEVGDGEGCSSDTVVSNLCRYWQNGTTRFIRQKHKAVTVKKVGYKMVFPVAY